MDEISKKATLSDRKQDHIELAFRADMANTGPDKRFYYEPMLSGHPQEDLDLSIEFLGKRLNAPLWISSMTGGTEKAQEINKRLAATCSKFGLGMGLGSCRPLLQSHKRIQDFNVRPVIGQELPFYANLGIAQVEELIDNGRSDDIDALIQLLDADGLIVHINPLQEWLQPEGDFISNSPLDIINHVLDRFSFPIIVKEVGQGMGPESLAAILKLPVAALELAAHGGTNFSKLELLRSEMKERESFEAVSRLGHTVEEMIGWINEYSVVEQNEILCRQFIISGGIRDFLDGYFWMSRLTFPSVYGQASGFLKYAQESQEALDQFVQNQLDGLRMAQTYLKVR